MIDIEELCGNYTVTHVDGKACKAGSTMTLSHEGDDVMIFVQAANTMRGKVSYENETIKGMLMSTMMMGDEDQMKVEDLLSSGLSEGMIVRMENGLLLFKSADETRSIVWSRTLQLDDLYGTHAIIGVDGQPPCCPMTIQFAPDGNGGVYLNLTGMNSMRGHGAIQGNRVQGDFATTMIDSNDEATFTEDRIQSGLQRGFDIRRNATGIRLESTHTYLQLCQVVDPSTIQGEYLLKSFNRQAVPADRQYNIAFTPADQEGVVDVNIGVANRMRGRAYIYQNVVRSDDPLMCTRMMGDDLENTIESAYNSGFQCGLEALVRGKGGKELTLRDARNIFVFTRVSAPEASNGEPQYKGTYCGKCFKTEGNGLLFRIVNENEKRWAYYNDTTDYRMLVHGTFGSRSQIQPLNKARYVGQDENGRYVVELAVEPGQTEMYIEGTVNGFKMLYSAEPVDQPEEEEQAQPGAQSRDIDISNTAGKYDDEL